MNKKEHEGRRARMRERFINEGMEHFEDHEALELLLYYAIPGRDTNLLAHKLIEEFGGLFAVLEAPPEEIMKRMKLSKNTAVLLSMVPSLCQKYMTSRWGERLLLNTVDKAGEYLVSLFAGKTKEEFYIICLNNANKVLTVKTIATGTINETQVYPRNIVEIVLNFKAASVILAHNHPGGSDEFSKYDIDSTKQIETILSAIGVRLLDHIVVAGKKYISMAKNGIIGGESKGGTA